MHHAEVTRSHFGGHEENPHMSGFGHLTELHGGSPFDFTNGPSILSAPHPTLRHAQHHAREASRENESFDAEGRFNLSTSNPFDTMNGPSLITKGAMKGRKRGVLEEWGL